MEDDQTAIEPQIQAVEPPKETEHIKELRQRYAETSRENAEYKKRLEELEKAVYERKKIQVADDIDDDSYVEGRKHKEVVNQLQKQQEQFQKFREEQEAFQAEIKLRDKYSDFNQYVNEDNLKKLVDEDRELARTIYANQNIYDRGVAAYNIIKSRFASAKYKDIDEKIDANLKKPRSISSSSAQAGDSPLAQVSQYDRRTLSDEDKKRLNAQRRAYMKQG